MHRRSVTVFDRFLAALSTIMTKAEAQCEMRKFKPEVILADRLFPDMFSFTRQVQLACDFATRCLARLAGQKPKSFPDTETSFAELQDRITAARGYIANFPADVFAEAADRSDQFKVSTQEIHPSGQDFLSFVALPQFFFHLITAYAILRHNGVEIGKRNYMGAA